jgi:hypothetical protein
MHVDSYNKDADHSELRRLRNRLEELKGKVLMLATRNTACTYRTGFPEDLAKLVDQLVGPTAKLRGVGYRQPYACMGVVGSREGPLEVIGERGCLVRLEAKLTRGALEQKKFHTYDLGKAILKEVQPGNYEYDKDGYQLIHGRWANDPVDLVQKQATKKLKLQDFPYKIEYLPHCAGREKLAQPRRGTAAN